ncbi:MAG TPA: hypothetical protein VMR50_10870 [Myxococcota bacterium]|nr:hypothetical protein [Myxococcota bacterium]
MLASQTAHSGNNLLPLTHRRTRELDAVIAIDQEPLAGVRIRGCGQPEDIFVLRGA